MNIRLIFGLAVSVALCAMPGTARATRIHFQNIFETNGGTALGQGTIGQYDDLGNVVNSAWVSGLSLPTANTQMAGLALSQDGNDLFVANPGKGTIGELANTDVFTPAFVSDPHGPQGIAVSGNDLFVANLNGTITEYSAMTGMQIGTKPLVSASNGLVGIAVNSGGNLFVVNNLFRTLTEYNATGMQIGPLFPRLPFNPTGIAIAENHLFVTSSIKSGTITEYNAMTGKQIGTKPLVSGLNKPIGIAVFGGNLFVANFGDGTIGEYNDTNGMVVKAPLVTGLNNPTGIAVFVPEPATWTLLLLGLTAMFGLKPLLRKSA